MSILKSGITIVRLWDNRSVTVFYDIDLAERGTEVVLSFLPWRSAEQTIIQKMAEQKWPNINVFSTISLCALSV